MNILAIGKKQDESRSRPGTDFPDRAPNAQQLVGHAFAIGCSSVFTTDSGPFERRLDDDSLSAVHHYVADKGAAIALELWSICPTSKTFEPD